MVNRYFGLKKRLSWYETEIVLVHPNHTQWACANLIKNKHGGEICQNDRNGHKTCAHEVLRCFRGGENCPKLYSKVCSVSHRAWDVQCYLEIILFSIKTIYVDKPRNDRRVGKIKIRLQCIILTFQVMHSDS